MLNSVFKKILRNIFKFVYAKIIMRVPFFKKYVMAFFAKGYALLSEENSKINKPMLDASDQDIYEKMIITINDKAARERCCDLIKSYGGGLLDGDDIAAVTVKRILDAIAISSSDHDLTRVYFFLYATRLAEKIRNSSVKSNMPEDMSPFVYAMQ